MRLATITSFVSPRALVRSTSRRWWAAFVLLAALAACSDGGGEVQEDGGQVTTITVEVPNGLTARVEYSVRCFDVQSKLGQTDLDRELETVAEGSLEPVGVGADGRVPPTTVWRVLLDLPAASCFVDLETQDRDGALLCSASEALKVDRRAATEKYVLMSCEEPVGRAHLVIEAPETLETAEIEAIAFTATCFGNEDRFLDPTPPIVVEGMFEHNGGHEVNLGAGPVPVQVWVEIVRDLPPGPCLFEFVAFDIDDEQLCELERGLTIPANAVAALYTLMLCPR
jgi:hypothetical protein